MLCTIIRDVYAQSDAEAIAEAIDELASPNDNYGWASAGLYCFWDPETNQVLYMGLAIDLCKRFKQHNGLVSSRPENCKVEQIKEWFKSHDKLGFSMLVQSPISQPMTQRNSDTYSPSYFLELLPEMFDPVQSIRMVEGIALGATKLETGDLPEWNKIGGSRNGAAKATVAHNKLTKLFTFAETDEFVARKTIRELAENDTWETFEEHLHGVRQLMAYQRIPFAQAWEHTPDSHYAKQRIIDENYLDSAIYSF